MNILKIAKKVIEIESKEIANLSTLLTIDFENAVKSIINSKGKLIISGMGKSGIVGKKIAATLASTGTPSFFLHPGEAYHGDLGMVEKDDIVLLISNSGETDEVLKIIPFLKNQKNTTISMSGNLDSSLAKNTDFHLNISVNVEACPLQLAPTSSTTSTMVMGDALAVALMKLRDFKDVNFARFHPGGSLGKRLLQNVSDVMKKDSLPLITPNESIKKVINILSSGKCGLAVVVNNNTIIGVISDGDIRRAMESNETNFFKLIALDIMTKEPQTVLETTKLKIAGDLMFSKKINSLIVKNDKGLLVGIVQSYDLGL
ncbi:KpsF/GutQ family sugar-phosphate isomerase [Flavobacteriaceae bacterium]|nr:KpsF/GutQ family sugar-phosphate isomerase [Flavobacteriaceae bacterium]